MSIGALLLQPQTLNRFASFDYNLSLGDDVVAVARELATHAEWTQQLIEHLQNGLTSLGDDIVAQLQTRMDAGTSALRQVIDPLIAEVEQFAGQKPKVETVGDVLELFLFWVNKAVALIKALSLENIRDFVTRVFDIVFRKFGFSIDYLQQLLVTLFDRSIALLEPALAAESNEFAAFRQTLVRLLKRVKREVMAQIPAVNLDADAIAREMLTALRGSGLDAIQQKSACIAEKIAALFGATTGILSLIETGSFGPHSVGAAQIDPIRTGKQYCWYASWLMRTRHRSTKGTIANYLLPFYPGDEVWVSEDGKKLILRGVGADKDEVLYESNKEINWYDAPMFNNADPVENFTFTKTLSPDFLETWTRVMSVVLYGSKMVGHMTYALGEPRNGATHGLLTGWNLARGFGTAVSGVPLASWMRDKFNWNTAHRVWIDYVFQWGSVLFGSIQGRHSETTIRNQFLVWFTLLGDDAQDSFLIHEWPTLFHEAFLSIFTLINYKGPAGIAWEDNSAPKNREYVYPLVNLSLVFWSFIFNKHVIPREQYSHPFDGTNGGFYHKWLWLVSPCFGALAGVTGELVGSAFARSFCPRTLLIQLGIGAFKGWGTHLVANYIWKEGDTKDGKYNPGRPAEYDGYPDHTNSPYKLPIAKGSAVFVGQANQGMFSHFYRNDPSYLPEVYAFDFAHDFKDMIVATRSGTVVDYFDWIADNINPDNTEVATALTAARAAPSSLVADQSGNPGTRDPGANYILIRHDNPFNDETVDQRNAHDKDEGGTVVMTYGEYYHGANGGVRAAFNTRSILPTNIIGTKVRRGEAIMQAGDTGISFHNHLHFQVLPEPNSALDANTVVRREQMTENRTMPVVFADAKNIFKRNGRLFNLTWYESENEP
jgi:hypothetical protein